MRFDDIVMALLLVALPLLAVAVTVWIMRGRYGRAKLRMVRSLSLLTSEMQVRRAAIDTARRLRHDQRHHRIVLSDLLLRGQVDKALAYLEEMDREADENPMAHLVYCDNETVNAILSGYQRKAEKKGVTLKATANVAAAVELPDTDIVAVLANVLENAINATPPGGTITANVRLRDLATGQTFGLEVANPVPKGFALSSDGLPCARPDIGIRSIRRAIGRHHGVLLYAVADGVLTCQAVMKKRRVG